MNFKEALQAGVPKVGTWATLPSPEVVNVVAAAGLDFVIVDLEHGPTDIVTAGRMITAAHARDCAAMVRCGKNDAHEILRALDAGADGIIVPHIETAADCARAVSFMKYPPEGARGYSPYTPAAGYLPTSGYTEAADARLVAGIIVEGSEGIDNIEEVIDNPALDLVYVGTYDISCALGIPGKTRDNRVMQTLEKCAAKISGRGKAAGCLFHDEAELDLFLQMGITFLCYLVDAAVLQTGFARAAAMVHKKR